MPRKRPAASPTHDDYWSHRFGSPSFKRQLTSVVTDELRALAATPVGEAVDADLIRTLIADWDTRVVDREALAELVIGTSRRVQTRLTRRGESLLGLLDPQLVDDLDALLSEDIEMSPHVEAFTANLMQQEFIRRLFTDIIYTAIVSFNQRVNPLFGALTTRVLEEQIKHFIRLFMPALQQQATTFAVNKDNQRIVLDFTRAIARRLLDEPLRHYAGMVSSGQRRQTVALIRKAARNPKLAASVRKASLAAWDDVYRLIRDKKVGELLQLDVHAPHIATQLVELLLPALRRPHIVRFLAGEMALATTARR